MTLLGSASCDYYYSEDEYYSHYDQIYRRQDDFDSVRVIDEGISNILSSLPGQVDHQHKISSICRKLILGPGSQGRCRARHGPGQQAECQLRARGGYRDGAHNPGQPGNID